MPAKADEIMAESLLKGGKMLSKGCKVCGSPLFCIKGEECCVVCTEEEKQQREMVPQPVQVPEEVPTVPAPESVTPEGMPVAVAVVRNLVTDELQATVVNLCRRVQDEPDPKRCAVLLDCVRIAVLTLNELR